MILMLAGCGAASTSPTSPPSGTALTPAATPSATPSVSAGIELDTERKIGEFEGVTFIVGEGSEATFTVEEQLRQLPLPSDAVVRTNALAGEVHFDGRPSVIEIDLHQLRSDQPLRDRFIRDRMFPQHPVATFFLEQVGSFPQGFTDGEEVSTKVAGQLDVRGIQVPITFEVDARDDGDVILLGQK